jgi:hypothetical protein
LTRRRRRGGGGRRRRRRRRRRKQVNEYILLKISNHNNLACFICVMVHQNNWATIVIEMSDIIFGDESV